VAKLSQHLILFDIDGTLLRCGPQVRPLFLDALTRVFGSYGYPDGITFAGKTDPWIALELARATGYGDDEILPRLPEVRRHYVANLESGLRREGMCLLPGVVELLERLAARDDVILGLLTGNWQQGAHVKLSRFELGRFFSFGAFGDDAIERRDLVPVAMERARAATGLHFAPEQTLIVGDTAFDVDCARASGVPSLAVTTGFATADRLWDAGADWVFADLVEATREFELFFE
jgi:phosphoglycolate phosphatase-like HAD superfamily hydrolase